MTLSARNHLKGNIEEIQWGDVLAHITVRVGDSVIESVITKRSAEEMGLKKPRRADLDPFFGGGIPASTRILREQLSRLARREWYDPRSRWQRRKTL
jgi:molybdopterin-binding protein